MTALAYLALHPGSARAMINVSGAAQALPFSIAIRSLQREAIRLDPAVAGAYNARGYAYHLMKDNEQAFANFEEAIRLDPEFANTYNSRAYTYLSEGNVAKALDDVTLAIQLNPMIPPTMTPVVRST